MRIAFQILDAPELGILFVYGRDAWALMELHRADEAGCTPIDHPGPRWSGSSSNCASWAWGSKP